LEVESIRNLKRTLHSYILMERLCSSVPKGTTQWEVLTSSSLYLQDDGKWSSPFNLGFPMNTPDDDYFFVMSPDGKRAYYSSTSVDGLGGKDLYMVKLDSDREDPVTVYRGAILEDESGNLPKNVIITVNDLSTGELFGVYRPRADNGRFIFILEPGRSYEVSYEANGYLLSSETLVVPQETAYREVNRAVQLKSSILKAE
jgi:hypothetical protein